MNNDYTHITLVVDRSGSMARLADEASSGINKFIEEQKAFPGKATLTLVQFNTRYDMVYEGDIQSAPWYRLDSAGMTALYDAVAKAIEASGSSLANLAEADRPGKVLFVIVTDGEENSSQEHRGEEGRLAIKSMVERQAKDYSWEFVFLAANMDAQLVGAGIGVANAANFAPTNRGVGQTYSSLSHSTRAYRGGPSGQSMPRMPDIDADGNEVSSTPA